MSFLKRLLLVLIAVLVLGAASLATVEAQSQASPGARPAGLIIPEGFKKITATIGVELLRKDYQGGTPDFVQVVDFSQGAAIELLHGPIQEKRPGEGVYGGDDPRIASRTLKQYWNEFATSQPNPFCVVNGQFFYMPEAPTRLPFPLKVDGEVISDGYAKEQFPGKQLMLELWPGRADINALTREGLYRSTAPDIVAGLAEDAPKNIKKYVGRTFIGVVDKDGDDLYETLLIFATRSARQVDAAQVLRSFGAQKVMMLDGGGSTQMICQDKDIISSERLIPQALGVRGGVPSTPKFNDRVEITAAEQVAQAEAQPAQPLPAEPAQAQVETAQSSPQVDPAQNEPVLPEVVAVDPAQVTLNQAAPDQNEPAQLEAAAVDAAQATLSQAPPAQDGPPKPLYELADALWVPGMMAPAMAFIFLIVWRMRFS